jgi:CRISPR-associated protein Csb2
VFVWADGAPLRHARALARLAARVDRSCTPILELRVLVSGWRRDRGPSGRPPVGPYPTSHLAGHHVVLRRVGPGPAARFGLAIAYAVRGAVLKFASDEAPEGITGHRHDGRPSERPHLVIAPIPDVGRPDATGEILGVLLYLPNAAATARTRLHQALEGWRRAGFEVGFRGQTMRLERASDAASPPGLRVEQWFGPATDWATATPIALDLNPGNLVSPDPDRRAAAYARGVACVRDSITRLGLPAPEVSLRFTPPLAGAYAVDGDHPPFPIRADRVRRVQVHAMLHFASPVAGPIVVGAGRYLGLGLCKPLPSGGGCAA